MVRTFAVDQLFFGVEALATVAVKPAVLAEIDIAGIVDPLQDLLHKAHMMGVGGADEVIVGDAAIVPDASETAALTRSRKLFGSETLASPAT